MLPAGSAASSHRTIHCWICVSVIDRSSSEDVADCVGHGLPDLAASFKPAGLVFPRPGIARSPQRPVLVCDLTARRDRDAVFEHR